MAELEELRAENAALKAALEAPNAQVRARESRKAELARWRALRIKQAAGLAATDAKIAQLEAETA
jgi:hypothetical protein